MSTPRVKRRKKVDVMHGESKWDITAGHHRELRCFFFVLWSFTHCDYAVDL